MCVWCSGFGGCLSALVWFVIVDCSGFDDLLLR